MYRLGQAAAVWVLSAITVCAAVPFPAASLVHTHWDNSTGLPQNSVTAIAQTADGYLWLGTEDGLARFDGVRFVTFAARPRGLPNNIVLSLLADGDDLWIGTNGGGLTRWRRGAFTVFDQSAGLTNKVILSLARGPDGSIWAGSDGGGVFRFSNGHFSHVADGAHVYSIAFDGSGAAYLGANTGVLVYDGHSVAPAAFNSELRNHTVRAMLRDRSGALWAGTASGLYRIASGTVQSFSTKDGLASDDIYSLREDPNGAIWIGTAGNAMSRYADGTFATIQNAGGPGGDQIWAIAADADGVWAGSAAGLHRFHRGAAASVSETQHLPARTILGLFEDRDGGLWLGSDRGLIHSHDGQYTLISERDGLPDSLVLSVAQDGAGTIWAGTRKGLVRIEKGRAVACPEVPQFVDALYPARDGSLWIGTRSGLVHNQAGSFITYTSKNGLPADFVTAIAEDKTGTLWIGTGGSGVARLVGGKFSTALAPKETLPANVVKALYVDGDSVYVATNGGGLSRIRNGRVATLSTDAGLPDDSPSSILDDLRGNLWFSSNRGVFVIPKSQLEDFFSDRTRSVAPIRFGEADGMRTRETNGGFQPASWLLRSGEVAFPTMDGLCLFAVSAATPASRFTAMLEKIAVNGREVLIGADARLPAGAGNLEFAFTAPEFDQAQSVEFRYRLEGFDRDWIMAGSRRSAFYTNIPHGKYRFVVQAGIGGHWSKPAVSPTLQLQPEIWQTLAFYLIIGMTLLVLASGIHSWRVNQLKAKERDLLRTIDQRTSALRETERQVRRSRDELEIRIHQRTIELVRLNRVLEAEIAIRRRTEEDLRAAQKQAETASRAKSAFLTGMSHQIRGQIKHVLSNVDQAWDAETNEARREYLAGVRDSAESVLSVLDAIVAYARMELQAVETDEEEAAKALHLAIL